MPEGELIRGARQLPGLSGVENFIRVSGLTIIYSPGSSPGHIFLRDSVPL